jgi:cell division protein FtsI (penicillin-binding protein 3)
LRAQANAKVGSAEAEEKPVAAPKSAATAEEVAKLIPAKQVDSLGGGSAATEAPPAMPKPLASVKGKDAVVVNAGLRVPVPSFEGAALRSVVEKADEAGLRVQVVGSGLAREQVPAAGTMVPAGTEVVVRFTR